MPQWLKKGIKICIRPSHVVVLPYAASYAEDGFATIHNCDFIEDPLFKQAYGKGLETGSWVGIQWRAHVYAWFASQAFRLPGDFVECGVNKGGYARMLFEYLPFTESGKKFYLMDTFNGFDVKLLSGDEIARGIPTSYDYTECYEEVKKTFENFPNAILVRGQIPGTLNQVPSGQIAFLSIDMNCVEPEIAAAQYFWDKMVSGGVVILDDYGHPLHINQKRAFDQFAAEKGVKILQLPTEQGLILKP
jgi:O-methyltransferase